MRPTSLPLISPRSSSGGPYGEASERLQDATVLRCGPHVIAEFTGLKRIAARPLWDQNDQVSLSRLQKGLPIPLSLRFHASCALASSFILAAILFCQPSLMRRVRGVCDPTHQSLRSRAASPASRKEGQFLFRSHQIESPMSVTCRDHGACDCRSPM
jgi:hypothetical protein